VNDEELDDLRSEFHPKNSQQKTQKKPSVCSKYFEANIMMKKEYLLELAIDNVGGPNELYIFCFGAMTVKHQQKNAFYSVGRIGRNSI